MQSYRAANLQASDREDRQGEQKTQVEIPYERRGSNTLICNLAEEKLKMHKNKMDKSLVNGMRKEELYQSLKKLYVKLYTQQEKPGHKGIG